MGSDEREIILVWPMLYLMKYFDVILSRVHVLYKLESKVTSFLGEAVFFSGWSGSKGE